MSKFQIKKDYYVHHQQNNSPSKFSFSFSKTPRFFEIKRDNKVDKFYNLPSTISKRSTAMGFGHKMNLEAKNTSEFISIKRYFDKGNLPGLKYSFGISRDKYSKVYYPGLQLIDLDIPGPGKYNITGRAGLNSPKYTMRPKCIKKIIDSNKSPGPGKYSSVINFNSEGKYPSSRISNVNTICFGKSKSRRFYYRINNVPGPGTYKLKSLLGINYNSKYNSGKLISLHCKIKDKKTDLDCTPGPGSYSSLSEFGTSTLENFRSKKMKKIKKKILSANGNDKVNESCKNNKI